jgi:flavin-dependent dehydrogenase
VRRCDALIVGGGPAGSTCARALRLAGWNVIVADRARFPRDKVCGGWLTPEVFTLLQLDPAEYRATGLTLQEISGFRTGVIGGRSLETRFPKPVSYAIRRCEFDHFLLRRAAVPVLEDLTVAVIRRQGDTWIVNDEIETPVLVGAGGHFCPVARHIQGRQDAISPVIARELEFRLSGEFSSVSGETPELFFCRDLEGYGWCVRKGDYLNVGIGRRPREDFSSHVREFTSFLVETRRAPARARCTWHGHAYHATGAGTRPLVAPGAVVIGDAAGLAYPESGEGIRPAIESAVAAARTLISAGGRHGLEDLRPYETAIRAGHRPRLQTSGVLRPAVRATGRALLQHSRWFTRRFVVERWFLRAG